MSRKQFSKETSGLIDNNVYSNYSEIIAPKAFNF